MAITVGKLTNTKVNNITINTSYACSSGNYTKCSSREIKYVVMHYTGNSKDNAVSNAKYFQTSGRNASAHFFVDDSNIYQSVGISDKAWHCGCSTGYKNACRNANSVGIEMCTTAGNYKVSDTTIKNAAYLCAYICKMVGITANTVDTYVVRHYDVVKSNKICPKQFVENATQWTSFKTMVKNILNGLTTTTNTSTNTSTKSNTTTNAKTTFIKAVQSAIGAKVDGVAGTETLNKTVTVSKTKNTKHAVVKPLQTYLNALGYNCGTPDGVFGNNSKNAVMSYQKANGCTADGEVTAKGKTWKKLLGLA